MVLMISTEIVMEAWSREHCCLCVDTGVLIDLAMKSVILNVNLAYGHNSHFK